MAKESKTQLGALLMPIGGQLASGRQTRQINGRSGEHPRAYLLQNHRALVYRMGAGSCPGCVHGRGGHAGKKTLFCIPGN